MRIAICDDEPREQDLIEKALQGWDPTRSVEKFDNGASLLEAAAKEPPFDIVFLDVYMSGENGMEIAGELKRLSPEPGIVFVTSSTEHAVDAFALDALHYLVKPVTTQGVVEAFRRLTELRVRQREAISISAGGGTYTVHLSQILTLESGNHAVEVVLLNGQRLKTWMSLNELEQKLDKRFLKINRGIIVNMDHIERMGTDRCIMQDGKERFLMVRRRGTIYAAYQDYLLDRFSKKKEEKP